MGYKENQSLHFYRPLFVSGSCHDGHAIVYNTASGKAYYFEGITTRLIGVLLRTPREASINVTVLSNQLQMSTEKIVAFFRDQLMPEGLIADHVISDNEWKEYHRIHPYEWENKWNDLESIEKEYVNTLPAELQQIENVVLELTYVCSERCIHCFNDGAARSDMQEEHRLKLGQMDLEEYCNLIDQMVAVGVRKVTVSGGDPFSHPQCWEILTYLSQKNLLVTLQTNAYVLNDVEKIRRLAHLGIMTFAVTLYSDNAAVHDSITRMRGSWQRSMDALEALAQWPIKIEVKCPVFKSNVRSYFGVHRICERFNATENFSVQLLPGTDGDISIIEKLNLDDTELKLVLQDKGVKRGVGNCETYEFPDLKDKTGFLCSAQQTVVIGPTGNVGICTLMPGKLGNLRRESLHDIIKGASRQKVCHRPSADIYALCGQHDYCRYCGVICLGGNSLRTDGPYKPLQSYCQTAQLRMQLVQQREAGTPLLQGDALESALSALRDNPIPTFSKKIVDL